MSSWTIIAALAVSVAACSKDKPAETSGTPAKSTDASTSSRPVDVEAIRVTLLREHPAQADQIRTILIREKGGVVTLWGAIRDERLTGELAERVRRMPGVRGVDNQLSASQPAALTHTVIPEVRVEEVRASMMQERPNDADVIRGIAIDENGGVVTIRGRVYDEQMKADLHRAAKKARGVRDVRDDLEVDRSMNPKSAPDPIRSAMRREHPKHGDAIDKLTLREEGGQLVLRGTVPDEATKKQLVEAAKKASGGRDVKSELTIEKK